MAQTCEGSLCHIASWKQSQTLVSIVLDEHTLLLPWNNTAILREIIMNDVQSSLPFTKCCNMHYLHRL